MGGLFQNGEESSSNARPPGTQAHLVRGRKKLAKRPLHETKGHSPTRRNMFSQKTKAPARNADPRRTACFRSCFPRKQKPLLGTLIRDGELVFRTCFLRKQKPLLGPLIQDGELVFSPCFRRKQEPLLGTLIQDGELVSMCTSVIISDHPCCIDAHQ